MQPKDAPSAAGGAQDLEKSKALFDAVFGKVSVALAILRGPDAVYERINRSYESLFNDRPLIGKTLLGALPELAGQKFPEVLRQVFDTGETYLEREARAFLRRSGESALEERFFDQSYTRIDAPDGAPYGVLIEAIDVTERVKSRAKLIAEAKKNSRLLRFMPTAFFSVTDEWILNYMNPAAEEILGLRAQDLEGRVLWEVFPGLVGSRFGDAYVRAMTEGIRIVTQDYYPDFDRWYEAWAYPFDSGLAVSFFDITQRKRDELKSKTEKERLEAIFHGSASPMVFFRGPDLVYEMINQKYEELVPKRDLLGKPLAVALPELVGTGFPEIIKRVFDTGQPAITYEELAPLVNPVTGEVEARYFDSGVSRINDGEGSPYGVFVQATEVTERVLTRKKIEEALAARDTFLSIASHELRTPITGMKLQAQMMRRALSKGDPQALSVDRVNKLLERTDQGLTRMSKLVEDMLDVSHIQAGRLALNLEATDLVGLVEESLERFSEELSRASIPVRLRSDRREMMAPVDRFRIEQVLTNLVTNAIKYAPGAQLWIDIVGRPGAVQMVFQDGGPGIAASDRERIFERFERLAPATHVAGLGLGLFIVRKIVEAHGGRISAESSPAGGARLVVQLPAEHLAVASRTEAPAS
jgi:signal transduction histidine kinase